MQTAEHESVTLSVRQAASYVGVSTKTIYRAVEDGRLKASCLGRGAALRIRREWIDEWLDLAVISPPADQPVCSTGQKATASARIPTSVRRRA